LLRHKLAVSSMDELATGSIQKLIPDASADAKKVKRVVLCSGKVYYDLPEAMARRGADAVGMPRVEQLYPFPREERAAELGRFGKAADVVWCQEEPQSQGACYQIRHRRTACLGPKQSRPCAGRLRSPSPA